MPRILQLSPFIPSQLPACFHFYSLSYSFPIPKLHLWTRPSHLTQPIYRICFSIFHHLSHEPYHSFHHKIKRDLLPRSSPPHHLQLVSRNIPFLTQHSSAFTIAVLTPTSGDKNEPETQAGKKNTQSPVPPQPRQDASGHSGVCSHHRAR